MPEELMWASHIEGFVMAGFRVDCVLFFPHWRRRVRARGSSDMLNIALFMRRDGLDGKRKD